MVHGPVLTPNPVLTFQDAVVAEVQVQQEAHVQQRQRTAEQQPRRLAHRPGEQHRHLQDTEGMRSRG